MGTGKLEMELTDYMASVIKETFNIEIEMMQGDTLKLPDGRTRYTLQVNEEKGKLIVKFIMAVMFKNKQNSPN